MSLVDLLPLSSRPTVLLFAAAARRQNAACTPSTSGAGPVQTLIAIYCAATAAAVGPTIFACSFIGTGLIFNIKRCRLPILSRQGTFIFASQSVALTASWAAPKLSKGSVFDAENKRFGRYTLHCKICRQPSHTNFFASFQARRATHTLRDTERARNLMQFNESISTGRVSAKTQVRKNWRKTNCHKTQRSLCRVHESCKTWEDKFMLNETRE